MMAEIVQLTSKHAAWHPRLSRAAISVAALGNLDCLQDRVLALFCSISCPSDVIQTLGELALALREAGVTVAGGFHTSLEREALRHLLHGTQSIIICPARGIASVKVADDLRMPLADGRLLVLSPFTAKERRPTAILAQERNRFVAALADAVCIAHAAPDGQLATLAGEVVAQGKPLLILPSSDNAHLVAMGARALAPAEMVAWWIRHGERGPSQNDTKKDETAK